MSPGHSARKQYRPGVRELAAVFTSGEVALAVAPAPLSVPVPMLVPPLLHELPAGTCEHRKKVTVPLGVSAAWLPVTVAVSWTATPGKTGPALETWVANVALFCWLT